MSNQADCTAWLLARGAAVTKRSSLLGAVAGIWLIAAVYAPAAGADSIFPQPHTQAPADQTGPVAPRDPSAPPRPYRSREEIDADIQSLESERADLLTKYSVAHPDVRAIDRRLRILREQREMLDRAPPAAK